MLHSVLLVKSHKGAAQSPAFFLWVNYKGVQHHHTAVRRRVTPIRPGVHVHLNLIDDGRSHNFAVLFFHKQVVPLQRRLRRSPHRVYAPLPANLRLAAFLLRMNPVINRRDSIQIRFSRLANNRFHCFSPVSKTAARIFRAA